jgi:Fe(3+) dicitrate transport protein
MLQLSCNNALNEQYFTRRAESYPGPGIIPADGRAFFLSLQIKI